jgi:hypothetical protein
MQNATISDLVQITEIADVLGEYKLEWEYQYVDASVERDNHKIFLSYPPKPISLMYCITLIAHPEIKDSSQLERMAQEALKSSNVDEYLRDYISNWASPKVEQ